MVPTNRRAFNLHAPPPRTSAINTSTLMKHHDKWVSPPSANTIVTFITFCSSNNNSAEVHKDIVTYSRRHSPYSTSAARISPKPIHTNIPTHLFNLTHNIASCNRWKFRILILSGGRFLLRTGRILIVVIIVIITRLPVGYLTIRSNNCFLHASIHGQFH